MSRYRLDPTPCQEAGLLQHCAHARFVWNLAVEQYQHWSRYRGRAPGFGEQCRQLTEARAEFAWLSVGSVTVQQQALRDFAQAMKNFFAGTHRRPSWRKAGVHEGFRQVGLKPHHVRRRSRRWAAVLVPKVGWVRFRLSRPVPAGTKSYRVTRDRAGRWHIAFAHLITRQVDRRTNWVEQTSTTLARRFDVIGVENLNIKAMTTSAKGTIERPGRAVAAKAGLNREILASGWGGLVERLEHKAAGRVLKVHAAYTSQTCSRCGTRDAKARESQARFACRSCPYSGHADVNAAHNIARLAETAAGRAVAARGGDGTTRPVNHEPQHLPLSA